MPTGIVKSSPRPPVNKTTGTDTTNMMTPPMIVAYNMPKGPNRKDSTSAMPKLFCLIKIVVFCGVVFTVLISFGFLRNRRYADPARLN